MTSEEQAHAISETLLAAGGEMADLMRSHPWESTGMGPIDTWPASLKTTLRIILGCHCPMFIWWGEERISLYNDACRPLLGRQHPRALGQSAVEVWAEGWAATGPQVEAVWREGRPDWQEGLLLLLERGGDRQETYLNITYSPILEPDGTVQGVLGTITDETERVVRDRRLQTLQHLTTRTAAVRPVDELVRLCATVLAENPHDLPFALLYRFQPAQLQLISATGFGKTDLEREGLNAEAIALTAPDPQTRALYGLHQWLQQFIGSPKQTPAVPVLLEQLVERFGPLPAGAGVSPPRQALLLPLGGAEEQPWGLLLAGLNPHQPFDPAYQCFLEQLARQMTTAIAQVQVQESQRQLSWLLQERAASYLQQELMMAVIQQLQSPLTVVLGWARLLQSKTFDPVTLTQALSAIERNATLQSKLVKDLLDASDILSGQLRLRTQWVDLPALIQEAIAAAQANADAKAIQLLGAVSNFTQKTVLVDGDRVRQIIINLLDNALKFTPQGGQVSIRLERAGFDAQITVMDTGIGIAPELLPTLFDRFTCVPRSQPQPLSGLGIGLAIARHLVELHHGTIEAISEGPGRGATFIVRLPVSLGHITEHNP